MLGADPRLRIDVAEDARVEAAALIAARQHRVETLLLAGAQGPRQITAVHRIALIGKWIINIGTVSVVRDPSLGAQSQCHARSLA